MLEIENRTCSAHVTRLKYTCNATEPNEKESKTKNQSLFQFTSSSSWHVDIIDIIYMILIEKMVRSFILLY